MDDNAKNKTPQSLPARRWFDWPRFRFRTLLIGITILCVLLGWFALEYHRAERQRKNVAYLEEHGLMVVYQNCSNGIFDPFETERKEKHLVVQWIDQSLGIDFLDRVKSVGIPFLGCSERDDRFDDETLKRICELSTVEEIDLREASLAKMNLSRLGQLKRLKSLKLELTDIDDEQMAQLTLIPQLRVLDLSNTEITDDSMPLIAQLTELETLDVAHTRVTYEGLKHLKQCRNLTGLLIEGTQVTPHDVERLKEALPDCSIRYIDLDKFIVE